MANRMKELKTRALEVSKTNNELREQKKINISDLSKSSEALGLRFEDESDRSEVESVSKAVTAEQNLIDGRIKINKKDIDKTSGETDDYINAKESNLRKIEMMEEKSNLVDVGQQKSDTKKMIGEAGVVKRILAGSGAVIASLGSGLAKIPDRPDIGHEEGVAIYKRLDGNYPTLIERLKQTGVNITNMADAAGEFMDETEKIRRQTTVYPKETISGEI